MEYLDEVENSPALPPVPDQKFRPSAAEKILALGMYVMAYLYVTLEGKPWLISFPLLYVIAAEIICRNTPRSRESWVWLGSMLLIVLCRYLDRGRIWDKEISMLAIHALAVWWLLCRSGKLTEGRGGDCLPLDLLDGFILFPFGHFFLRIKTVFTPRNVKKDRRGVSSKSIVGVVFALLLSVLLLSFSAKSLIAAARDFGRMLGDVLSGIKITDAEAADFIISLPVGAYLFGQIAGSRRVENEKLDRRCGLVSDYLEKLRIVPGRVWVICSVFFLALYTAFILWQASYLFGAFTRNLPENFVVSEYARQGFFELCRVIVINFLLYWLILRTGTEDRDGGRLTKAVCTLILVTSILFAVIAGSKLALYISNFSFTPRRVESCWLILMLAAGCAAALRSLWTDRKTMKSWLMLCAVSFALLHIW